MSRSRSATAIGMDDVGLASGPELAVVEAGSKNEGRGEQALRHWWDGVGRFARRALFRCRPAARRGELHAGSRRTERSVWAAASSGLTNPNSGVVMASRQPRCSVGGWPSWERVIREPARLQSSERSESSHRGKIRSGVSSWCVPVPAMLGRQRLPRCPAHDRLRSVGPVLKDRRPGVR